MGLISFLKILFFLFNYTPTNLFLLIRNGQKYPSNWKQNEKWRKKKKGNGWQIMRNEKNN